MRLPDDFDDEDNSSMGLPMVQMVIGAAVFILLLFGIILAVNYKNNNHSNKDTDKIATVETTENQDEKDLKNRTEELISGSTLRSDDLDFWDMYPEQETKETEEKKKEETKEEPQDPSTDGKHTLVTYASGRQEWVTINPYMKKNSYDYTNLVSQNNVMKYYEGSRLTSFLGVDISKNDGTIDFDMLKAAGVSFVMIRTGSRGYESGQLMEDELFTEHIDGALTSGLDVGLYFSSAAISKEEAEAEAISYVNEIMEEAKMTANMEAKKVVIKTIQRVATETATENAVSIFHIDSDEIKGRIIGREGRNIRALEAATGVEIIVDDTPEAIVLSGFDPVRREIARLSLHQLVTDGRIHPARIEEVVNKVKKQIEEEIIETGKRTTIDLGVHGLHPELIRLIGKMKYRSSYGQNLLQHARETANLCAIMAAELGLNVKKAKRAGLLHDIGKVPDDEPELPHAILGMQLAEKYKEKPDICNAIGAHHEEIEMTTLIAPIVQACDAISGARPGARREVVESYIKRLKDMEDLALSYNGVVKTYAIQAGRELRVVVGSEKISDAEAEKISFDIAKRIQDEMTYPGQVKVTVIRETRAINYAK